MTVRAAALFTIPIALAAWCGDALAAEPWVGTWAAEKAWCRPDADFEERPIVITRQDYSGLENECRFTRVRKRGAAWHVQASCIGEGRRYRENYIYRMRGETLVVSYPMRSRGELTFVRCP